MPHTPLLDKINNPQDLKKLDVSELKTLADELRLELIDAVSVTGGHLGAGLGVVELTICSSLSIRYSKRSISLGCRSSSISA